MEKVNSAYPGGQLVSNTSCLLHLRQNLVIQQGKMSFRDGLRSGFTSREILMGIISFTEPQTQRRKRLCPESTKEDSKHCQFSNPLNILASCGTIYQGHRTSLNPLSCFGLKCSHADLCQREVLDHSQPATAS